MFSSSTIVDRCRIPMTVVLFFFAGGGCSETLPPRENLSDQITARLSSKYYVVPNSTVSGDAGMLQFFITLKNELDETLEDVARFNGTMDVTWLPPKDNAPHITLTRSFTLTSDNIIRSTPYDPVTRRLTLPPGDSITLRVVRNMKTNDSSYLLMYMNTASDSSCMVYHQGGVWNRRITGRQRFLVTASVRMFDRLAVLRPVSVTVSHCLKGLDRGEVHRNWPCADLDKVDPCVLVGE